MILFLTNPVLHSFYKMKMIATLHRQPNKKNTKKKNELHYFVFNRL